MVVAKDLLVTYNVDIIYIADINECDSNPCFFIFFIFLAFMYFVCVYPGCKTVLPKIVACETAYNDDRIEFEKKKN